MIKIAFITSYITHNGPGNVILGIIKYLDKTLFDISLITLFDKNDLNIVNELKENRINVFECKKTGKLSYLLHGSEEFNSIIKKNGFDILHSHGLIPDILSSRIKAPQKVSTVHCHFFEDYIYTYGKLLGCVLAISHTHALKKIDRVIFCSHSLYDAFKKYKLKNAYFIRNGIDTPHSLTQISRKEMSIPDDAGVFIYTGGLTTGKKIQYLIRQFVKYRLDDEYLLVLGEGPEENACRQVADSHVIFCGFQKDPIPYLNISDVYCSASKSEGFSIAVLEALFCGLELFLSDIPSHREIVSMQENSRIGFLFTEDSFLNSMNELRKMKKSRTCNTLFAESHFSALHMSEAYQKEYRLLLEGQ